MKFLCELSCSCSVLSCTSWSAHLCNDGVLTPCLLWCCGHCLMAPQAALHSWQVLMRMLAYQALFPALTWGGGGGDMAARLQVQDTFPMDGGEESVHLLHGTCHYVHAGTPSIYSSLFSLVTHLISHPGFFPCCL